jgi:hypothetical protein
MKKMIFCATVICALLGVSSSSFACNSKETLRALNLEGVPNTSVTLGQEGYDGAEAGVAAQITNYFAQEGCRVDQGYLLTHIGSNTPIGQIQLYVRFQ